MSWPLVKLSDLCVTTQGVQITKADTSDAPFEGGYRYLYIADFISDKNMSFVRDEFQAKKVTENDLVMANTGSPGRVFKGKDGILSNNLFKISFDRSTVDKNYLYLWLSSDEFQKILQAQMKGGIQKHLGHETIGRQFVPLPPLEEQKRIAAILDKADFIRRKRQQAIKLADDFLRSVFLEMFGDPVTNPKGWEVVELSRLVDPSDKLNYGVVQPGEDEVDGTPLVRSGDLSDFTPDMNSLRRISASVDKKHKNSKLKGNEILIACVGSIGRVGWVTEEMKGWNIARAVTRIPVRREVNREYLYRYLQNPVVQGYFEKETRAVAQPTLNVSLIAKTPIALPPEKLQLEFLSVHKKAIEKRDKYIFALHKQSELFESLSQKAFSGLL